MIWGTPCLSCVDELKERERILEEKVEERTREIAKQKDKIQELYKDVTDSIKYAKRLQNSHPSSGRSVKRASKRSFCALYA